MQSVSSPDEQASNVAPDCVAGAFDRSALQFAAHPFLCTLAATASVYQRPAGELSYREARVQVDALRAGYAAAGYGHGHRVGLLLENRPEFILHWFALNALGVSVVPINADLRSAELEYLVGHSEIVLAVAPAARHAALRSVARSAGTRDAARRRRTRAPRGRLGCPARERADRPAERVRAALHLGHDRAPQGLRAHQSLLPARGRLVRGHRRVGDASRGQRTHAHAAAAGAHERDGLLDARDGAHRRLPDPARSLSSGELVGQRARVARHGRALSGRDARNADEGARAAERRGARPALRFRRRRGSQPARRFRAALRLSAARGLGDDRNRRRRRS